MNERPCILKGKISLKEECIIGKVIVNKNVEDKTKFIQVLDDEHIELFEKGYRAYIFQNEPQLDGLSDINYCYNIQNYETIIDYDVLEISDKSM